MNRHDLLVVAASLLRWAAGRRAPGTLILPRRPTRLGTYRWRCQASASVRRRVLRLLLEYESIARVEHPAARAFLMAAGCTLKEIMEYMGHSNLAMAQRYVKLLPQPEETDPAQQLNAYLACHDGGDVVANPAMNVRIRSTRTAGHEHQV